MISEMQQSLLSFAMGPIHRENRANFQSREMFWHHLGQFLRSGCSPFWLLVASGSPMFSQAADCGGTARHITSSDWI